MSQFNCNCRCSCTAAAVVASLIIGVITAFLQITGIITVTTAFLWVALGIAVVYLGVLVVATALTSRVGPQDCVCSALSVLLTGILGTILFSVVLLAVGIVATSVASAILVGLLLLFATLTVAGTACYVRYLSGCER